MSSHPLEASRTFRKPLGPRRQFAALAVSALLTASRRQQREPLAAKSELPATHTPKLHDGRLRARLTNLHWISA